jgi:transcriptional regulator with XRE-family HTH domain
MNAATILRDARRRVHLTQAELADRAGTSQATLSAYENGRKQPSIDTLSRLLAATGSRLVAVPGRRPVTYPSAAQLAVSARALDDVLGLAAALPTEHDCELRFPRLGRSAG